MCSHVSASGVWLQVLDAETQADQDDEAEEYIEADEEEEEEEEEDVDLEREMEYEDEDDEVSQQASQMQNDKHVWSMGVDKRSTHTDWSVAWVLPTATQACPRVQHC